MWASPLSTYKNPGLDFGQALCLAACKGILGNENNERDQRNILPYRLEPA